VDREELSAEPLFADLKKETLDPRQTTLARKAVLPPMKFPTAETRFFSWRSTIDFPDMQ
jgi:hypothetical protein